MIAMPERYSFGIQVPTGIYGALGDPYPHPQMSKAYAEKYAAEASAHAVMLNEMCRVEGFKDDPHMWDHLLEVDLYD